MLMKWFSWYYDEFLIYSSFLHYYNELNGINSSPGETDIVGKGHLVLSFKEKNHTMFVSFFSECNWKEA